jgi:hypothetical protein
MKKSRRVREFPLRMTCPLTDQVVVNRQHEDGSQCWWSRGGHVRQIVSAPEGWQAIYRHDDEAVSEPIACWALVERCDGSQDIVGWVAAGDQLEAANDDTSVGVAFAEYQPPSRGVGDLRDRPSPDGERPPADPSEPVAGRET